MEITNELADGQLWFDETLEAVLLRRGNQLTAAFFESGVVVRARVNQYRSEYYMNFIVQVPRSRFHNRTYGFLGNLDGDQTNEFYRRGEADPISDAHLSDRDLFPIMSTCKYNHSITCRLCKTVLL